MRQYERILVPFDFSSYSMVAAEHALNLAHRLKSEVRFLHVLDLRPHEFAATHGPGAPIMPDANRARDELVRLTRCINELGTAEVTTSARVVSGIPSEQILAHADEWKPSMIVMGSKGRTGLARVVLGSQAELVLRRSKVPTLIVHDAAPQAG